MSSTYVSCSIVEFYYILAFLLRNRGKFRRIIYQDLFDTFFQGDPFSDVIFKKDNEIHVTTEYSTNVGNGFMRKVYKNQNITVPEEYRNKYFKNSSHCAGIAENILKFFMLFVSTMSFKDGWDDQGQFNYLEFSGELNNKGLYFSSDQEVERFLNLRAPFEVNESLGNVHAFLSDKVYAFALHRLILQYLVLSQIKNKILFIDILEDVTVTA